MAMVIGGLALFTWSSQRAAADDERAAAEVEAPLPG
jgi:hypothetical protein